MHNKGEGMDTQFKKGVLELCILKIIEDKDLYGYEVIALLAPALNVNENTIYPILRRLTELGYFETYTKQTTIGAPRKYYHITRSGREYLRENLIVWREFNEALNEILNKDGKNDA